MSLKILVIDDQLRFIDLLREQLTSLPYSDSVEVFQASNSQEGKEQFVNKIYIKKKNNFFLSIIGNLRKLKSCLVI